MLFSRAFNFSSFHSLALCAEALRHRTLRSACVWRSQCNACVWIADNLQSGNAEGKESKEEEPSEEENFNDPPLTEVQSMCSAVHVHAPHCSCTTHMQLKKIAREQRRALFF